MAEHEDHDREAIMARRRRFIALALGGLATGCAPGKPKPMPNSTSTTGHESESASTDESGDQTDLPKQKLDVPPDVDTGLEESGSETGTPRPCLVPPLGPSD